ncbi:MAG TPA: hypothetical protein V6D26_04355 [Stenomitos sp.]
MRGGAFLQLTGNGIFPLFHLAVADELSSFVEAMDEDDVEPGFDFDNLRFRNSQEFGNLTLGDAEFFCGVDATE